MTGMKGYTEGVEYGRQCAVRMMPGRAADNDAMVKRAVYAMPGSPTRAFWLGFRRAVRGTA